MRSTQFLSAEFLLVGIAFWQGIVFAQLPPSRAEEEALAGEVSSTESLITELGCDCDEEIDGFQCDKLPAFDDYKWNHGDLSSFAERVIDFTLKLENSGMSGFTLAIKGTADSREIKEEYYKYWEDQNLGDCTRPGRSGLINDEDLAWLRSCFTRREILKYSDEHNVELLDPKDYKVGEGLNGDQYKSSIFYLLIEGFEGCSDEQ